MHIKNKKYKLFLKNGSSPMVILKSSLVMLKGHAGEAK